MISQTKETKRPGKEGQEKNIIELKHIKKWLMSLIKKKEKQERQIWEDEGAKDRERERD